MSALSGSRRMPYRLLPAMHGGSLRPPRSKFYMCPRLSAIRFSNSLNLIRDNDMLAQFSPLAYISNRVLTIGISGMASIQSKKSKSGKLTYEVVVVYAGAASRWFCLHKLLLSMFHVPDSEVEQSRNLQESKRTTLSVARAF